jgi:glucokinase
LEEPCSLIGDLGGTNARFALAGPNGLSFASSRTVKCDDFSNAELAITDFLERCGSPEPDVICLAVAGPIVDESVTFTNNHWNIKSRELRKRFPSVNIRLINDFEAIACSIPFLDKADLTTIGPEPAAIQDKPDYTIAVLGPGTGLGEAGLVFRSGEFIAVAGEGSHAGFAPENPAQIEVLLQLRELFDRVSDERLLSGPGLENIYWALCKIDGNQSGRLPAAEIFQSALSGEDIHANGAVQLFYEVLGQVAGNLALKLGAYDGIYIAGGIVKRYPELLKTSNFRSGFENKGRYRSLMETIPTLLITHPQPGLLGAAYCARQMV